MYNPKKNDTPNGNVASWEKADEDEVRIDRETERYLH